jgi:hypothetical protein
VSVRGPDNTEIAKALFRKQADGTYQGSVVRSSGPKGLARAAYDYVDANFGRIKPSTEGRAQAGKEFWESNALKATAAPGAQEQASLAEAAPPPAAAPPTETSTPATKEEGKLAKTPDRAMVKAINRALADEDVGTESELLQRIKDDAKKMGLAAPQLKAVLAELDGMVTRGEVEKHTFGPNDEPIYTPKENIGVSAADAEAAKRELYARTEALLESLNADRSNAASSGREPASVRRSLQQELQEATQVSHSTNAAAGVVEPTDGGTEPAPAPAQRGEADRDKLMAEPMAKVRDAKRMKRELENQHARERADQNREIGNVIKACRDAGLSVGEIQADVAQQQGEGRTDGAAQGGVEQAGDAHAELVTDAAKTDAAKGIATEPESGGEPATGKPAELPGQVQQRPSGTAGQPTGQSFGTATASRAGGRRVVGARTQIAVAGSAAVPARYEVRDLADVKASHQVLPGGAIRSREQAGEYPHGLQPRDYSTIGSEKEKVLRFATEMEPNYFISSHPDATSGPPTITWDGTVINGNGRNMALEMAGNVGTFAKYKAELVRQAAQFGIDPKAVEGMARPVLYRVVDMDPRSPAAQRFARAGNVAPTQSQTPLRTAASLSSLVDPNVIDNLRLEGDTTFSEAVSDPTKGKAFRDRLRDELPPQEVSRYFHDDGRLTDAGTELVRNMLLAKVLPVDLIERMGEEMKGVKRTLEGSIPQLLQIKRDYPQADVSRQLVEALGVKARNPEMRSVTDADNVTSQGSLFGGRAKPISPGGRMLLDAILQDGNKPLVFRRKLSQLVQDLTQTKGLFAGEMPDTATMAAYALGVERREGAAFGPQGVNYFLPPGGRTPTGPAGQPAVESMRRGGVIDEVKTLLAPAARGEQAQTGSNILRANLAEMVRKKEVAQAALKQGEALLDRLIVNAPDEQTRTARFLNFTDAIEGGNIGNLPPELASIAKTIRELTDERTQAVKDRGLVHGRAAAGD